MHADTKFHRQLKYDVSHVLLKGRIANLRPPTCFFLFYWICLLIAKVSLSVDSISTYQSRANPELILSNASSTTFPYPLFPWGTPLVYTFVSNCIWKTCFTCLISVRKVFECLFLKTNPKIKKYMPYPTTLRVSCYCLSQWS